MSLLLKPKTAQRMPSDELSTLARRAAQALAARSSRRAFDEIVDCLSRLGGTEWRHEYEPVAQAESTAPEAGVPDAEHLITLYGINESHPGPRWQALFDELWPAYRTWYLSEGSAARSDLATCSAQLAKHMPELVPTWKRLVALAGDDEVASAMLTMWNPPKFLPGCSQAVLTGPEPALVRNYDYSPALFEQVVYSSAFGDRKVIGTGDCLWGLLDGMNDAGLAVSLAFGGRPGTGPGFAAPLIVRYLLEVATTTAEAVRVLRRVPISMSYNLTIVDRFGAATTAALAPQTEPLFTSAAAATNHRGSHPDDPAHARRFRSVERLEHLQECLATSPTVDTLAEQFLARPLFNDQYDQAFGTLYTAVYRPQSGSVTYRWADDTWTRTFTSPDEVKTVTLRKGSL